jgi:hypothetical protein
VCFFSFNNSNCQLAAAGFYFLGGGDDNTLCQCYMCGKFLEGWETKDIPVDEHKKRSAACPALNLHLACNRLVTFAAMPAAAGSGPELAAAGFSYTPTLAGAPAATCFACPSALSAAQLKGDAMCGVFLHVFSKQPAKALLLL